MIPALPALALGALAVGASELSRRRAPRWTGVGYINGLPVQLELMPIDDVHLLRPDAAQAFLEMTEAARLEGIDLRVNTAFRTQEEQTELYKRYLAGTGALAAKPGTSNHQGGIAVDLQTGGEATPVYFWLARNASRYSFKRTVASEPWHWEFRPAEVSR